MTDDNNNLEWEGSLHLPIHAVHQLREMVRYCIQTWPGSPARPAEEQEFAQVLLLSLNQMALEHSFEFIHQEKPNERGDNKT